MSQKDNILFLGPRESPLLTWLKGVQNEVVLQTLKKITPSYLERHNITFLISYGYSYIFTKDILDKLPNRAINCHISYLPWNRGADPNFWSFVDGTPKGVTIHYLDEGIDTGDIIVQRQVIFNSDDETLSTTYKTLQLTMEELFKEHWQSIKIGHCERSKQQGTGSFHTDRDKDGLKHLLVDGWNTRISLLEEYAAKTRMSMQS
jgi:methionyl-tRNA formyltransferase